METCSRILNFDQISFNNILGCASELKCNEQGTFHIPPVSAPREVLCPEPRRSTRVPFMLDNLNRPNCKAKRNLPSLRGDPSLDIFNLFLATDDMVDELDTGSCQMDLLSCSPPGRTNNPLVHDVQFNRQTLILDSPSGNTHGGKYPLAREVGVPAHETATAEKPVVRIEGFACRGSKSQCISARA